MSSPFNLLRDAWLPVIRRSSTGGTFSAPALVRPAEITSDFDANPVVALAWPRPDFRAAGLELLIGLVSTAAPPAEEDDWETGWDGPPSPEVLDAAFAPYAAAFDFDGDGPRFLQDWNLPDGEFRPAASLLIEQPGENALKQNTDLLVKRGGVPVLSRASAAMALFTAQAYSPGTGPGFRTGFRGGGPLTTLVLPRAPGGEPDTLWRLVWANVGPGEPAATADLPQVFPWLAPTLTSGKGEHQLLRRTPRNTLQMFWSMPRRVRLDFAPNTTGSACGVTGQIDDVVVTSWRTRPYGAQYDLSGWPHPLTPHSRQKETDPLRPLHGQPGGIGYRHWIGLAVSKGNTRVVADTIRRFRESRASVTREQGWGIRLFVAGYDMDNAKARGFVEADMPLHTLPDPEAREALDSQARQLVGAAVTTADLLRSCLRTALFGPGAKTDAASTVLATARDAFWAATEAAFYTLLERATTALADDPDADLTPLAREWLRTLRGAALAEFDAAAPLDPDAYRLRRADALGSAQAVVTARRLLGLSLAGYRKGGEALFDDLKLPLPEAAASGRGKRKRKAA